MNILKSQRVFSGCNRMHIYGRCSLIASAQSLKHFSLRSSADSVDLYPHILTLYSVIYLWNKCFPRQNSATKTLRNHQVLTDIDGYQLPNWRSLWRGHTDGKKLGQIDMKFYYLHGDTLWKPHNASVKSKAHYKNIQRYGSQFNELMSKEKAAMKFWHVVSGDMKTKLIQLWFCSKSSFKLLILSKPETGGKI